MKKNIAIFLSSYALPIFVMAQTNIKTLIDKIIQILDSLVPLIFALAVILFLWGIVKFYFISGDDSGSREEGRNFIIWGVIALFVMITFWGFVALLKNEFSL